MTKQFYFNHENEYDGPYASIKDAREAALKNVTPSMRIEILQVVEVSEVPTRTWEKR